MTHDDLLAKTTKEARRNAQIRQNARARYGDPFWHGLMCDKHGRLMPCRPVITVKTKAGVKLDAQAKKYAKTVEILLNAHVRHLDEELERMLDRIEPIEAVSTGTLGGLPR